MSTEPDTRLPNEAGRAELPDPAERLATDQENSRAKRYYAIIGRADGWDEDSVFIHRCTSEEKAVQLASTEIANIAGREYREDDERIYINHILVSDTPITST